MSTVPAAGRPAADFSAAHSMDTDWFATDKNGHVALLDSGADGPVPQAFFEKVGWQTGYWTLLEGLIESGRVESLRFNISDVVERGPGKLYDSMFSPEYPPRPLAQLELDPEVFRDRRRLSQSADADPWWRRLLARTPVVARLAGLHNYVTKSPHERWRLTATCWLRDESVLQELPQEAVKLRLPSPGHVVVWIKGCDGELVFDLLEAGRILAILLDYDPSPHRFGFTVFRSDDDSTYDRLARPLTPVHLSSLPEPARAMCSQVRLESIVFEEAPQIRPADHIPCRWYSEQFPTEDIASGGQE